MHIFIISFAPDKPFQPSLVAGAYQSEASTFQVASPRDKPSSLLWKVVTYGRKKFYNIDARTTTTSPAPRGCTSAASRNGSRPKLNSKSQFRPSSVSSAGDWVAPGRPMLVRALPKEPGAFTINVLRPLFTNFRNKLECLSLANLSSGWGQSLPKCSRVGPLPYPQTLD